MDIEELDALLADLRATRDDHRTVEAKTARDELPTDLWTTISALCNSEGGTLLLGVREVRPDFPVVGVADPGRTTTDLRGICDSLEPSPRPVITSVHHPDGEVVVAQFMPTPRHQRPCHLARLGPRNGSYRRVGDGDIALSEDEVAEMQAAASHLDYSNTPAAEGAVLDAAAVASFLTTARDPRDDLSDDQLLHRWNIAREGVPTLAGVLTLGDMPDATEAAAQVLIERLTGASADSGSSLDRRHGTVGRLLDDVMAAVCEYLPVIKIAEPGGVVDDSDVPRLALRELISNALMHRSFSPSMLRREVRIQITDDSVTIISPGCLPADVDAARLGLDRLAPARNHALVRVAERLTTPSGRRIVEHAASGIPRADAACRQRGTLPPLFTDNPTEFHATLVRGRVDDAHAEALLGAHGAEPDPDSIRLVAALKRLTEERMAAAGHPLSRQAFDTRLATRVLAPAREEVVMAQLAHLEAAGVLRRRALRQVSCWELVASPSPAQPTKPETSTPNEVLPRPALRKERKGLRDDVLRALLAAEKRQMRPVEMREMFSISSPNTLNDVLTELADKALIEPTETNPRHPRKAFRLTRSGAKAAARLSS